MPEIGIVLVDDHPIVLDGLVQVLSGEPDLVVLAACARGEEALSAAMRLRPRVLLLDARLPDRDGIHLLTGIAEASPQTCSIVFTAALEEERIVEALRNGARAVLFKDTPAAQLIACIRAVAAGAVWIAPGYGGELAPPGEDLGPPPLLLSRREREIAQLVARGARNKEIAWELGLAEGTVKLHISRTFRKLGVGNRVELCRLLAARG